MELTVRRDNLLLRRNDYKLSDEHFGISSIGTKSYREVDEGNNKVAGNNGELFKGRE